MMQGIIFDADGTLLDSMPIWEQAGSLYLQGKGILPEKGLAETLFSMSMEEGAAYLKENYGLTESVEEIVAGVSEVIGRFYREQVCLKPGAKTFLEQLKRQGIPMTVATSSDRNLIEAAFKRLGVSDCFCRIITCSQVQAGKTRPDIFLKAAEVMNAPVDQTWVFEDALHAVKTAKEAGFLVTAVYDKSSEADQEEIRALCDIYIRDFRTFTGGCC